MKTLVLYYSYGGTTRKLAQALAADNGADLVEVRYQKKPTIIGAFFKGCPGAMGQKPAKVRPIEADFAAYGKIILMAPVWAGYPAPPFNSMLAAVPAGTTVELRLVSSGGASKKEKAVAKAEGMGQKVADCLDIKAPRQD